MHTNLSKLIGFNDDSLGETEREKIAIHLESCSQCMEKLREVEWIIGFVGKNIPIQGGGKSTNCHDDVELLSFATGNIGHDTVHKYQRHFVECPNCLNRLIEIDSMLHQIRSEGTLAAKEKSRTPVKARLPFLIEAPGARLRALWNILNPPKPAFRWLKYAVALLVVSLGLLYVQNRNQDSFLFREGDSAYQLRLLQPQNMKVVQQDRLGFEWSKLESVSKYTLLILDSGGDIILEQETNRNNLELPQEVQLTDGVTYLWQVAAVLESGVTIVSDMSSFIFQKR
jgi:hypothetical protein